MNVLFVSAEVVPFSKAGGLGDVAGSLPQALSKYIDSISTITPLYGLIDRDSHKIEKSNIHGSIMLGEEEYPYKLYHSSKSETIVETWFVESEQFFDRQGIYIDKDGMGFEDNNLRFFFFQLVVLDLLSKGLIDADTIHCNDHHTGLLPGLIKGFDLKIKSIFTIHNFLYHGHFSLAERELFPVELRVLLSETQWENYSALLEGIDHSDIVTTVSPGYGLELLDGMEIDSNSHEHIIDAKDKFFGIINGIDTDYWSPEKDAFTPFKFSIDSMSGKLQNKIHLLQTCGLDDDSEAPIIGSISRLVENKGFHLIVDLLDEFVALGVKFIFLGSGEPNIAKQLRDACLKHPGRIFFDDGFNEPLAHLIEAGCDMFLMPSRFEPCGLNQLYSLRYGTIPIVHRTGGLGDTVEPWSIGEGTGFVFNEYNLESFKDCLHLAIETYRDPKEWNLLMYRAMQKDFSWDRSAKQYRKLYLMKKKESDETTES